MGTFDVTSPDRNLPLYSGVSSSSVSSSPAELDEARLKWWVYRRD